MDIDLQNMGIIDVGVELPPIPQEDLEEEEKFYGLVNLVAFPRLVKQYFRRPNYFELYLENKFVVFLPVERHCTLPTGKDRASNIIPNRRLSCKITKSFLYYLLSH